MERIAKSIKRARILGFYLLIAVISRPTFGGTVNLVSPDDNKAGATTLYEIDFTTASTDTLFPDGKIFVIFSSGFDLSGVSIASSSTINGGFSVTTNSDTVKITRDGTGDTLLAGSWDISFANVVNNTSTGNYTVTVEIRKNDNTLVANLGSGSFSIAPGDLSYFTMTGYPGGVTAGDGFSTDVTVTAYDAYGNPKTDYGGTVSWSSTDSQADLPADSTFNGSSLTFSGGDFVLKTAGSQTITVTDAGAGVSKESDAITVSAAAASDFSLSNPGNQTAGVGFSLSITGAQDQYGNLVSGTAVVAFVGGGSHDSPDGTSPVLQNITVTDGSGSATQILYKAESGVQLQATLGSVTKQTNAFSVNAGVLNDYTLSNPGNQTAGVGFSLSITGAEDEYGNLVSGTAVVSFVGGGNHDSPGGYSPALQNIPVAGGSGSATQVLYKAESGVQLQTVMGGISRNTNSFDVTFTDLDHVLIVAGSSGDGSEYGENTLQTSQSFTVHAAGYDAYGNYRGDENVNWSATGNIGYVSPESNSSSTTFTATQEGTGVIIADHPDPSVTDDQTGTITVTEAEVDHIIIRNAPNNGGTPVGDTTITADDQLTLYAAGYDAGDNYLGDVSVTWSLASGDLEPTISGSGSSYIFSPTKAPANGVIRATHAAAGSDLTGTITVDVGVLASIKIRNAPNNGGDEVGTVTMTTDDNLVLYAAGYDADGNFRSDQPVTWSSEGLTPPVSASNTSTITFSPTKPGSGTITADAGNNIKDDTGAITVRPGKVASLTIRDAAGGLGNEVGDVVMTLDDKLTLYAAGYDQYGNYAHDVVANWSVSSGDLDDPDPLTGTSTTFDPTTPRTSGKIQADSAGIADETGTITVGSVAYVLIRTAPNGAGIELGDTTLTADDYITLYAAGYDAGGNYIGDVTVDWQSTGTLTPSISTSGTISVTFAPTTAPATGTIIADHSVATDDVTGTITITPGKPVGEITLTPIPAIINANGSDTSRVTSSVIRDSDDNPAQGALISVNVTPQIATIIKPSDAAPEISGYQVTVNSSGYIAFTLQAGTTGGTATIIANSVDGGNAYGDTTLTLMSLNIVSINALSTTVSRGQPQAQVNMRVQNLGGETVTIQTANLTFSGPNPLHSYDDDYTVEWTENITSIPPGSTVTLIFQVGVDALAALDSVTIDGEIAGEMNGVAVSDVGAETTDKWLVQTQAHLEILKVSTPVDTITQGQKNIPVSMTIENTGQATALITTDSLTFWSGGTPVASDYQIFPNPSNPDSVRGGEQTQLNFSVTVSNTATLGEITVNGFISGHDANSSLLPLEDASADTPDSWFVKEAPVVGVISFQPSQQTVTQGQDAPWYLTMEVGNSGGSAVRLDSARVKFFIQGIDRTDEYEVLYPSVFLGSGTAVLDTGSVDSIKFTIQETGISVGEATVQGRIYLTDMGTHNSITDQKTTGITVQTPANLSIESVTPSQSQVTRSQKQDWTVTVEVKNSGQSSVTLDTSRSMTYLIFSSGEDFLCSTPVVSDGLILAGNSTKTLTFTVDSTGQTVGTCYLSVRVRGTQNNDGTLVGAPADSVASVKVETPADLRILDVRALASTAPNAPHVNTGQKIKIRVRVENKGEDGAYLTVLLSSNGSSLIEQPISPERFVPGGLSSDISFNVRVSDSISPSEVFTATIDTVRASNTNDPAPIGYIISPAVDSTEALIIEKPAGFNIVEVIPSQDTVTAGQTTPWQIQVVVQDTGVADLKLNPPTADNISMLIGGARQYDYRIEPPESFPDTLKGGDEPDTLIYRVIDTGKQSGQVTIRATLSSRDVNNDSTCLAVKDTTVFVEPPASNVVRIINTFPFCQNMAEDIGIVNTGQQFEIPVVVENATRNQVDSVVVTLSSGGSLISPDTLVISSVGVGKTDTVRFTAIADSVEKVEKFTSRIVSAAIHGSSQLAEIGTALDSTALVIIQQQAQLVLSAWIDDPDGILSPGQTVKVTARIDNRGTSEVDTTGRVSLRVPNNYWIAVNGESANTDTTKFYIGQPISWVVHSPDTLSGPDSLVVTITHPPNDKNTADSAKVVKADTAIVVNVSRSKVAYRERLHIYWPEGAKDDTLSTQQEFRVKAVIFISPDLSNKQSTILLPDRYSLMYGENKTISFEDTLKTVQWRIRAPNTPDSQPQWLKIITQGKDGTGKIWSEADSFQVYAVKRANLSVDIQIVEPPGAVGGNLSVGQLFILQAKVINTGSAEIISDDSLSISFGETGVMLAKSEVDSVKEIKWLQQGLATVEWWLQAPPVETTSKPLTVSFYTIPKDENTNAAAEISKAQDQMSVRTVQRGSITIDSVFVWDPPGATDCLISTDQDFSVKAIINSGNCNNLTAEIILPSGYDTEQWTKPVTTPEGTVSWRISAPPEPGTNQPLVVITQGYDAHNDTLRIQSSPDTLWVTVVNKAVLEVEARIVEPPEAADGIVSTQQTFVIAAEIKNRGQATLLDEAMIWLHLPDGFITAQNDTVQTQGLKAYWEVKAPATPTTMPAIIRTTMIYIPKDENSNLTAAYVSTSDEIAVTVEEKKLQIEKIANFGQNPVAKGQKNVPLLGLSFKNLGAVGSNDILITALRFYVRNRHGQTLDPSTIFARLSVRDASDTSQIFGEITTIPQENPVSITFLDTVRISPNPSPLQHIGIYGDLLPNATSSDFEIVVENNSDITAIDAVSGRAVVFVDRSGQTVANLDIVSNLSVVVEANFDAAFHNYPNPFGDPTRPRTNFVYFLDAPSSGEIRIYTLTGKLVWKREFKASDPEGQPGLHGGDITWDGTNGDGIKVLNGVYLAVMTTSTGKKAVTKVAVVK